MNDAVLMIGEARPELAMGIAICEGVADGLAIASRFPQTSVVLLGAGKAKRVAPALADYNVIDLFADSDEAGERWGQNTPGHTYRNGSCGQSTVIEVRSVKRRRRIRRRSTLRLSNNRSDRTTRF